MRAKFMTLVFVQDKRHDQKRLFGGRFPAFDYPCLPPVDRSSENSGVGCLSRFCLIDCAEQFDCYNGHHGDDGYHAKPIRHHTAVGTCSAMPCTKPREKVAVIGPEATPPVSYAKPTNKSGTK
jgi:hypothetical protein